MQFALIQHQFCTPLSVSRMALPSHTLTFTSVYRWYRHCIIIAFVLALVFMLIFESSPHCSRTMDQDQTFRMESTDLKEDALDDMLHRDELRCPSTSFSANEYNLFNLWNINSPTPPKWKNNENILEDFKKFKQSCMCIFDGPMAHITNGKVKTDMFLIWAGPNTEDICENLHLASTQQYNIDAVLEAFERYYKLICNFTVARWKFRSVKQHDTETINTFYHHILRLAC